MISLHHTDCLSHMRSMEAGVVDSIVTDPPYGLSFMGKDWDHGVPGVHFWEEALRVAKPGAHLLAFGGTRTFHRLAVAIEDAGWEMRDTLMWVYGSGFPKSHDVGKAIDRAAGAEREAIGVRTYVGGHVQRSSDDKLTPPIGTFVRTQDDRIESAPATDAAKQWQGWGTALKPAWEPIIMARKPLQGTVASNVQTHGTGAINVDGCRVGTTKDVPASVSHREGVVYASGLRNQTGDESGFDPNIGRWPANVIHDGSEEVVGMFPQTTSGRLGPGHGTGQNPWTDSARPPFTGEWGGDTGSAARFFYTSKASKADRDEGLNGFAKDVVRVTNTGHSGNPSASDGERTFKPRANHHPTVKPTDLMRYLCRLVTPPKGIVFDPFMGSGSTGKAAILEGFSFIGCDLQKEYVDIARARIEHAERKEVERQGLFAELQVA